MAYFYLYRMNGGEVTGASTSDSWPEGDYFDVYQSDTLYELSPPKWCDGEVLRDATEAEITNFAVAEAEDLEAQQKDDATDILHGTVSHKDASGRMDRATVEALRIEINTLRVLHSLAEYTSAEFKALVESAIDAE